MRARLFRVGKCKKWESARMQGRMRADSWRPRWRATGAYRVGSTKRRVFEPTSGIISAVPWGGGDQARVDHRSQHRPNLLDTVGRNDHRALVGLQQNALLNPPPPEEFRPAGR